MKPTACLLFIGGAFCGGRARIVLQRNLKQVIIWERGEGSLQTTAVLALRLEEMLIYAILLLSEDRAAP